MLLKDVSTFVITGNVLVNKQSSGVTQIVLLDHGLYTQLSNKFRWLFQTNNLEIFNLI